MEKPIQTCFYKECDRPVYSNSGDCIFHTQNREVPLDEFTSAFNEYVDELKSSGVNEWRFDGFQFPRGFEIRNYEFPQNVSFRNALFRGLCVFAKGIFQKIDFEGTEFRSGASFSGITIEERANFYNSKTRALLLFSGTVFKGSVCLAGASIDGLTIKTCIFSKQCEFNGGEYLSTLLISDSIFDKAVLFQNSSFGESVYINQSTFNKPIVFDDCRFNNRVSIKNTEFYDFVRSSKSRYGERLEIKESSFSRSIDLSYTSFSVACLIENCRVQGRLSLSWPGVGRLPSTQYESEILERGIFVLSNLNFDSDSELSLRGNRFPNDCQFILKECNMSHVLLNGAETKQIGYENCRNWPNVGSRIVMKDENLLRLSKGSSEDWFSMASTYQGLARAFDHIDFYFSNHFQAGVYESRRMAARKQLPRRGWSDYIWLSLFRLSSGYSTNLTRPVLLLFCTILVFPFGYWLTSIQPETNPLFWNSFNVSLQVSTLIGAGKEIARGNSFPFNILVVLQMILTFSLVSLFLLALRRTFRNK